MMKLGAGGSPAREEIYTYDILSFLLICLWRFRSVKPGFSQSPLPAYYI